MASIDEFFQAPSDHLLTQYTKEQLLKIADNYGVEIGDKRLKENIRTILKTNLVESGILKREEFQAQGTNATLNFEQQKELLKMQLEYEKLKQERELEVQLELEKMKFKTEQTKLELEHYKLNLIKDGKLNECSGRDSVGFSETSSRSDLSTKLKMVPKFNERDPDTFFSLFERVAETCEWLDTERTLLLQCVFTGKAQEAYSALSSTDSKIYVKVKAAVLKAYELVPEAYRQHFRGVRKREQQTHVEFVREMVLQFNRWCSASEVVTFQQLCDLVTLEQFKNCVPDSVATYLNERKVKTPHEAAVLADEYILTHKSTFVDDKVVVQNSGSVRTSKSFLLHGESGSSRFDRGWKKGDPSKNCNYCQRKGHWKNDCPVLKRKSKFLGNAQVKPAALAASAQKKIQIHSSNDLCPVAESNEDDDFSAFISDGYVSLCGEKVPIKILRDTGAKHSFICESVLPFSSYSDTRNFILMRGMGMTMVPVPVHKMELVSGFVTGEVEIGVRPALPVEGIDMILGNDLAGSRVWADDPPYVVTQVPELPRSQTEVVETNEVLSEVEWFPVCAVTRAMGRRKDEAAEQDVAESKVMVVPVPLDSISHGELIEEQKSDPSIKALFELVSPMEEMETAAQGYFVKDNVLVRKWCPQTDNFVGKSVVQIVVPAKFREMVMKASHDGVAGHMGVQKTYHRILCHFFWPRLKKDVSAYIKTCHTCQLTGKPNQTISPAPLYPVPALGQPFEYLIMDCVGPLPPSKSGSKYLLTVMCQVTRYPAAYPLRSITTKSVVKALSQFVSVFGIPKVIQTDQGSNFCSKLFSQVLQQLQIKHNQASAYHPQSQGALERFHQTLKSLLRAYCTELDRDWEEGLPWLLLAAREVVQVSTGFCPNDLVFGHSVRGPVAVLQSGCQQSEPPSNLIDYVNGFRHRLYLAGKMAKHSLEKSQKKMKSLFDRKAKQRQFNLGDQVMLLLPVVGSPFQAKFAGPFPIKKQVSEQDYLISMPNGKSKLCHVNLLKR
uniref:Gypsy retrotransposon integrase-like protein 1 n=1 Tax=Cynoglossus semilaevis TaxID=244447 RepID=A0A3P8WEH2_CYNSE